MLKMLIVAIFFINLSAQDTQTLDKIIAVIGDEMVTKGDVDLALMQLKVQQGWTDAQTELQRDLIMGRLIDEKLLYVKSKLDTIQVDEDQLTQESDARWRDIVARASQYGGEAYIEKVYNDKARNIKKRLKDKLKREMAVYALRQQEMQKIRISRSEVEQFFRSKKDSLPQQPVRVELANIVMKITANESRLEAAYQKALDAIKQLKSGKDFAELAKEVSEGPSAQTGGYLGKVQRGNFVKEYEDGVDLLDKRDDITETPVLSPFGYHVIKLHSKTDVETETSHILFMAQPDESDVQRALTRLDSIRREIVAGNITFEMAVQKYSDDESTKMKSGYLGIFPLESIPDENTKNLLQLMIDDELSRAYQINAQNVQIVKLIKKYDASSYNLNNDYSAIENMALNYKRNTYFVKMLQSLKDEIPIEIY